MTEMQHTMNETELVRMISGLKPQTTLSIEMTYEGISVPDFTRHEIASTLRGENSATNIRAAINVCLRGGLFEQTQPKQPRHHFGRSPIYYKTSPSALTFAGAYNRFYAGLIGEQLFEELPLRTIMERALGGYAVHIGLQNGKNIDPRELAQKVGLHPSTVIYRALGGYAMAMGAHRRVLVARNRLVGEQESL